MKIDLDTINNMAEPSNYSAENECFICRRPILNPHLFVHLLVTNELTDDETHLDSQGFFPIGAECCCKIPPNFVFKI